MSIAWLTLVLCFLTTFTTTISAFLSPQVPRIPKRIRPSNDSPCHRPPLSPLYGIKGFQAWFNTQFPDATIEIDLSSHESFDHVLVDMNQVLHVILRRSRSREHAIRLLMSELDRMVQLTTPTQSLVLAVDGPPAAAKLATQRRRRYGTLVRTQWKLTHFDKLRISKRSRTKRLRGYQSDLKSLEITPATQFMKSMEASLIYWAWQRLQQRYSKLQNVKIYINPSAVPGEGEIKLLEWIFEHGPFYSSTNTTTTTNNNNKKQQRGQSICFFGGDSDLLLEGLVIPPSFAHNVFVVRQEQTKKYLCISLWETTRTLAKTLNTNNKQQILQVRTDLVLLMIMNGNDYLPKLRGSRGFSNIVSIYMKTLAKHNSGLVHPDTLDFHLDFCISFFKAVVQSSPPDLWSTTSSTNSSTSSTNSSTSSTSTSNQPATQRSSKDNQEDDEPQPQSDRRTPLGELNNIIDGGFLPQRLRFRVIRDPTNINTNTNETEEEEDGVDDIDDDEEEEEEADIDDDDAQEEDNDDDDESSQVLVHMSLGNPGSDDFLLYEVWVDKDDPLKYAKQKLASMALDDFLGTDYAGGTDEFDFDAGITNRGYSWEISQAVEGKVDQYLGGLLWNLQTYQDGICADYGYNYGRRMSPTAIEIVDFLREAKAQSRRVGKQELLGDNDTSFRKPISAGLSCLAALPSEVKHLVPEPYQWLPNETVERLYEQCVDPIDNVFDLKTFEQLCEDEIAAVKLQRNETEEDVEHPHGRRIMTGDHYWTVLGKTNDPLKHPFDPPPPPSEEFSELFDNNFIKVSRVLATATPRLRSAWGHEIPQNKKRRKVAGSELVHSDIGKLLMETESIFDIEYKVAFPKDHDRHMAQQRRKNKLLFQKTKVKVKNGKQQPSDTQQVPEGVDILSRMKVFNVSLPPKSIAKNVDGQTALDVVKALEDVGMVGPSQFGMKTPSSSDFASFNPVDYEHTTLTIPRSKGRYNVLKQTVIKSQDRDLKKQSRKSLKQHLASLALDDITGPNFDWTKSTYSNLKTFLMSAAGVHENEIGKVSLTARLEEFNLLLPPEDPIENRDGDTAIVCLNQLRDVGMIGKTRFAMKSPSKSKYASFNPLNYEYVQLTIKRAEDKHLSVLREDLYYSQDRDVNKQTRRALRQHLASLALCDLTGPRKRWSEMTFAELRDFLKQKSAAARISPPPVE